MRLAVLLLALAPLPLLPGCLPIGGCGAEHQLHVYGPMTLTLARSETGPGCDVAGERTAFTFEVVDTLNLGLVSDDAAVTVAESDLDAQDYSADGHVALVDEIGAVDLWLTFAADGTITGDAARDVGTSCTISYVVTGAFTPNYQ